MKTVKPQALSLLTRPFELQRHCRLGITILAFVPLGGQRALLPEIELWPFAAEHLPEGGVLDEAIPKQGGEYLVVGAAWPRPHQDSTKCRVQVQVGDIDKSLFVFGDRHFIGDQISEPQPFESMPLDWTRSFGGPGFQPNPLGRGIAPEIDERGQKRYVLPNVEHPNHLLRLRDQRPRPASLGPIDRMWPQRLQKAGNYDEAWLKQLFPGFAADINWRYFNLADDDQHQPNAFDGDERYRLVNLHPERGLIEGKLPGISARCLVRRRDQELPFEPECRLTTVWFFPAQERAVLIFHASIEINEPDATDVSDILIAAEDSTDPRPLEHYLAVRERRLDPEKAIYEILDDSPLIPTTLTAAKQPTIAELCEGPGDIRMAHNKSRLEREQARIKQELNEQGLDVPDQDEYAELTETLDADKFMNARLADLPELIKEAEAAAAKQRQRLEEEQKKGEEELKARLGDQAKPPTGPPTFNAAETERELREQLDEMKRHGLDTSELESNLLSEENLAAMHQGEENLRKVYLRGAHLMDAPPRLDDRDAAIDRLLALLADDQATQGADFSGCDLRGVALQGANLSGIFLAGADLRDADLRGAVLDHAVLAHADLRQAQLDGASLRQANLGKARLDQATMTDVVLEDATLTAATLTETCLDGADFSDVDLREADLSRASLRGIFSAQLLFMDTLFDQTDFTGAALDQAVFIDRDLSGCDFSQASLEKAVMLNCTGRGTRFRGARMRNLRLVGESDFSAADFSIAFLAEANLRAVCLADADFFEAVLDQADFSLIDGRRARLARISACGCRLIGADLREADLREANLMQASLERADLRAARLTGANLYQLQLGRAHVSRQTDFDHALTSGMNIYPLKFPPKDVSP